MQYDQQTSGKEGHPLAAAFDREKFAAAVCYVAQRSTDDPRFGLTKLNKILYFSDFKAFGILGRSITGATYVRMDRGPVPEEMLDALEQLKAAGEIDIVERQYFNYTQRVVTVLEPQQRESIREVLAPAELKILDAVLEELRFMNASEVSTLSHLEKGWQLADDREAIPYETVYISDRKPSPGELSQWRQAIGDRRAERASR